MSKGDEWEEVRSAFLDVLQSEDFLQSERPMENIEEELKTLFGKRKKEEKHETQKT